MSDFVDTETGDACNGGLLDRLRTPLPPFLLRVYVYSYSLFNSVESGRYTEGRV